MTGQGPDGFLGRWSRLKRRTAQPEPEVAPGPEPEEDPEVPPEPEALSDEELAALPRIEDLTEGSDIRAFLQAGVPRQLRNAALRRMWMLTPAIRDYRDPAVDYAWDWNTPGGVPGDGAAPSAERAAEMLRSLVGPRDGGKAAEVAEEDAGSEAVPGEQTQDTATYTSFDAAEALPTATSDGGTSDTDPPMGEAPRRRHGSALPG